jgi:hypothetical protein
MKNEAYTVDRRWNGKRRGMFILILSYTFLDMKWQQH